MADARKYKAFISYSHRDRDWGGRLHRALERYRVPRHIAGSAGRDGAVPSRLVPIFRDREELPSSANLNEQIAAALDQSDYLIVICSPNSARSRWVNEEILRFKRLGRAERVLAFIVAGEPNAADKPGADDECFPPALRFALDAEGNATGAPVEPIAADARPQGDGDINAILKLIAGLLGVGFDDLRRRELEAQRARTRLRMAIAAGFGILITGAIAAGWIAWQRALLAEQRAQQAQVEQSLRLAAVARAQHDAGNPVRAALIAAEALPLRRAGPAPLEARGALLAGYALGTWAQGPVMLHDGELRSARFVDDGKRILSEGDDNTWKLWDADTGALLARIAAPDSGDVVYDTSLSPDRKRLLANGRDAVRLIEVESGRVIARLAMAAAITHMAFGAGGRLIVTATEAGDLRLWNGESGAPIGETLDLTFPGTQDLFQYERIVLDDQGTRLIAINIDGNVQVWDVTKGKRLADPRKHARDAAFSRDGSRIALAIDKTVEIWDADMKERAATLQHDGSVARLAFCDQGGLLASVSSRPERNDNGEDAHVWDIAESRKLASMPHAQPIATLAFNDACTVLATTSDDDTARLWEAETGTPVGAPIHDYAYSEVRAMPRRYGTPSTHPGALQDVDFSPDGQRLVVASRGGYAQIWDARLFTPDPDSVVADTPNPSGTAKANRARLDAAHRRSILLRDSTLEIVDLESGVKSLIEGVRGFDAAQFSADGGYVLLTSPTRRVGVLRIADSRMMLVAEHGAPVDSVDFLAARSRLATADRDGVHLWDVAGRKWLRDLGQPNSSVVRLSPDGARVLAAARDGTVRVFDVETGAAIGRPMQHDFDFKTNFFAKIPFALFDPGGTRVLTVSGESLRLWDAASGLLLAARAHGAEINDVRYSPDGRRILTASIDGTARLWQAADLKPAGVLRHRTVVLAAEFDVTGTRVVTLSSNVGATLWDIESEAELGRMKIAGEYASFAADGKEVLAGMANGSVWRWRIDALLAPQAQLPAVVYLASFPGLVARDRARYLQDAGGGGDADALAARDPCDVVVIDLAWRWRPRRNAAVGGMSFLDRDKEALRMCEESARAFPDQPRFVHNQGVILLARGRKAEALDAFRRAAEKNHAPAMLAMGQLLLDPAFAGRDPAKAIEILRQASARGVAAADSALAELHWHGEALEKDRAKALALWRAAALKHDAGACRRLAEMEESGSEVELPRDLRAALLHWTLAVEFTDRAGIDDRFAQARRASLARRFSREGQFEIVAAVWREALESLDRK